MGMQEKMEKKWMDMADDSKEQVMLAWMADEHEAMRMMRMNVATAMGKMKGKKLEVMKDMMDHMGEEEREAMTKTLMEHMMGKMRETMKANMKMALMKEMDEMMGMSEGGNDD